MAEAVLSPVEERERVFRRAVAISAAGHVLLLLVSVVSPFPRSRSLVPAGSMSVSLVAAPPAARPAPARPSAKPPVEKAKPKEAEKPLPPPPPEVTADKTLLPKQATKQPKPEPPKPKPKPAVAPPKPEEELAYGDALDSLREELGEAQDVPTDAPDPELLASVRPGHGGGMPGQGPGDPVDPEVLEWIRRVKIHVKRGWVVPPGAKRRAIEAEVAVTLDATGNVLGSEVVRRSGDTGYDDSVLRALDKASPLPPPPESGEWFLLFTPQDVL